MGDRPPCRVGRHHSLGGLGFGHCRCAWAHPQLLSPGPTQGASAPWEQDLGWCQCHRPKPTQGSPHPPHHPVVTFLRASLSRHCHGAQPQDLGPEPRFIFRLVTMVWPQKHVLRTKCTGLSSLSRPSWAVHVNIFFGSWLVKGCPGGRRWKGLPDLGYLRALQRCPGAQGDRLALWAVRGDRLAP